ncbi:hypothetical protein DE146DRAFT_607045 [Neofusicoccum parvum]|uniref:Uncharacterized protein n=1 Tax=Neofusicoccum parvum TaxID=310453 RepID=A0ACB5S3D7_9PEZI|nr:hypothetical protein DE146DRAFT_607045 [Neofusicoccum parvum]
MLGMLTGKGIGFCIVHRLAKRAPENTYLLAARSGKAGEEAIQQLRDLGVTADLEALEMDVTRDDQIQSAAEAARAQFGKIDVLVNNAAIAAVAAPDASLSDLRAAYSGVLDTNVTSVAAVTAAFLPLLRRSPDPRVVNVSSGRASMHALTTGTMPATVSVPYSVSKLAVNVLTLEMSKQEEGVKEGEGGRILYQAVNPGHCRTALNGFSGKRDPLEGAKVVEELVCAERGRWEGGFWAWEGDEENGEMKKVRW